MVDFYATCVINGIRTFAQVPSYLQPAVKEVLIKLGLGELAQ